MGKIIEYIHVDDGKTKYTDKCIYTDVTSVGCENYFANLDNLRDTGYITYKKSKYFVANGCNCILVDVYLEGGYINGT